jgi:hypothetical protein
MLWRLRTTTRQSHAYEQHATEQQMLASSLGHFLSSHTISIAEHPDWAHSVWVVRSQPTKL